MAQDADAESSGIVVANAGPLIALARVDQLSLLATLYGAVVIPERVLSELCLDSHRPGARLLSDALTRGVLRTHPLPPDSEADLARLSCVLDAGESAAILLAQALACRFLLIDERRGRAMARHASGAGPHRRNTKTGSPMNPAREPSRTAERSPKPATHCSRHGASTDYPARSSPPRSSRGCHYAPHRSFWTCHRDCAQGYPQRLWNNGRWIASCHGGWRAAFCSQASTCRPLAGPSASAR